MACFTHREYVGDAVLETKVSDTEEETSTGATRVLPDPFQRLAATAALEAKARAELVAAAKISAAQSSAETVSVKKLTVLAPPKNIVVGPSLH